MTDIIEKIINYINRIIITSKILTRFLYFVCIGENVSHDRLSLWRFADFLIFRVTKKSRFIVMARFEDLQFLWPCITMFYDSLPA